MRDWLTELTLSKTDRDYVPDAQELAEYEEIEKLQAECKHPDFNSEDGCPDCGFYAK